MATRLPAEQRRLQLLDVACDVFADRGFHATSMDEIAEAAGVTKPVLYQHFRSKRALYLAVLDDVNTRLLRQLSEATGRAPTGRERVQEGFATFFRFVAAHRAAFRVLFGASVRNDPEFVEVAEATVAAVADLTEGLIDIDVPAGHRRVLAHALVGMAEAASRRMAMQGAEDDPDRLASWLAEMAWFGLRGVRSDGVPAGRGPRREGAVRSSSRPRT